MGAGGHGFSYRNRSNTQINNRVAAKAAARPSPSAVQGRNISQVTAPPVVEEVVNLNGYAFCIYYRLA